MEQPLLFTMGNACPGLCQTLDALTSCQCPFRRSETSLSLWLRTGVRHGLVLFPEWVWSWKKQDNIKKQRNNDPR